MIKKTCQYLIAYYPYYNINIYVLLLLKTLLKSVHSYIIIIIKILLNMYLYYDQKHLYIFICILSFL